MSKIRITRRSLLHSTIAGGATALAAPYLIGASHAQSKVVTVGTWGGVWTEVEEDVFFKPFTKETGIEVRTVSPTSFAKFKAQVELGSYEFDITCLGEGDFIRAKTEGLSEPLNWDIIDRSKLWEGAVSADAITICHVATGFAYRTDVYPENGPKNWADFWDVEKFPGARGMYTNPVRVPIFALLADGVKTSDVYPPDIERAFRSLDRIKPHIKVWWTGGNQSQQLIRDGEVTMNAIWVDRAEQLREQGHPIHFVLDGCMVGNTMYGIVKGSPNAENAMRLLDFMARPEPNAEFSKRLHYVPGNPKALEYYSEEKLARIPNPATNGAFWNNSIFEAENKGPLTERFNEWLAL
jgi:putative spermidine/putrescine transport system substrate-binding protein